MADAVSMSVIVPNHNGARFLRSAVDSILAQKGPAPEIIVVDDGSTDDSTRVAGELGDAVCYLRQENHGPAAARNLGLERSSGEIVAFLDVDDVWREDKSSVQLPLLQSTGAHGVWGLTQVMMLTSRDSLAGEFVPWEEPRPYPQLGSFLFRREVFDRVGGFDPDLRYGEDIDLLSRILDAGLTLHRHADVVLEWRRHEDNVTNDVDRARSDFVMLIKRTLDRKRSRP